MIPAREEEEEEEGGGEEEEEEGFLGSPIWPESNRFTTSLEQQNGTITKNTKVPTNSTAAKRNV